MRRRVSAAALAAGHTVTADGCALGLVADTGLVAGLSWAEATHGVLLTGPDADHLGVAVACAALRRRKTVVIVECAAAGLSGVAGPSAVADRVRELATSLGVPVTKPGGAAVGGGTSVGSGGSVGSGASVGSGGSVGGVLGRAIRRRETVLVSSQHADAARQRAGTWLACSAACVSSACERTAWRGSAAVRSWTPSACPSSWLWGRDRDRDRAEHHRPAVRGSARVLGRRRRGQRAVGRDLALALAAPLQYSQPGPDAIGHRVGMTPRSVAQLQPLALSRPLLTLVPIGRARPFRTF